MTKRIICLRKKKDLESFVVKLDGTEHPIKRSRYSDDIYILDLRPYRPRKDGRQMSLFKKGYGKIGL